MSSYPRRYDAYSPYSSNPYAQAYFARQALINLGLALPPGDSNHANSLNPLDTAAAAEQMLQNTYGVRDDREYWPHNPYGLDPRDIADSVARVDSVVPDNVREAERL